MAGLDFNPYNSKSEKEAHMTSFKHHAKDSLVLTGFGLFNLLGGAYVLATEMTNYVKENAILIPGLALASALGALFSLVGAYSVYDDYQILKAIKKTPVKKASEKTLDDKVDSLESTGA